MTTDLETTTTDLSQSDIDAHRADEEVIERGLSTFIEVGRALVRIRERRSYLLTHANFGSYIKERWRMEQSYVYRLIAGAQVIDLLEEGGAEVLPANPAVAYTLRELADQPEELVKAWTKATADYGPRPVVREIRRTLRGDPVQERRRRRVRIDEGAQTNEEPDLTGLTDDQRTYVQNIVMATEAVAQAKRAQAKALRGAEGEQLREWSRRVRRLRALGSDLQRTIDNHL